MQLKRQAATPKGLERRIKDAHLEKVKDPRYQPNVRYPLRAMLGALVFAMVTTARSLRQVEERTAQLANAQDEWQGIQTRIADNTFAKLIPRLERKQVVRRLHALVKAEHRRGNLKNERLPFSTVAIDGKNVATLRWHDLCRALDLDPMKAKPLEVKELLRKKHPDLQFCIPKDGQPYALARVHTATLISAQAAYCIHQRPIPGKTNEIGAMPDLLKELRTAYGRTNIMQMVTTDAGNTSLNVATMLVDELHMDYFAQFKTEHGQLYTEATRVLGNKKLRNADASYSDEQNGCLVTYHLWCHDLSEHGWLDWRHARQLVRVQRVTKHPVTGNKTVGNRYYVCSKTTEELKAADALKISRGHWRCEEETHWTADAVLHEDKRQLAWSRHPVGVFIVSILRMIALNILAVARKLSRFGHTQETPTWRQVAEHFLLSLCASVLDTERFDATID
ncbi:MAG: ISAs1 family transposase [Burkholderiaceae bacterium]|nr:ISAs1 family transposase [Burkholderiaceae bacterium]